MLLSSLEPFLFVVWKFLRQSLWMKKSKDTTKSCNIFKTPLFFVVVNPSIIFSFLFFFNYILFWSIMDWHLICNENVLWNFVVVVEQLLSNIYKSKFYIKSEYTWSPRKSVPYYLTACPKSISKDIREFIKMTSPCS